MHRNKAKTASHAKEKSAVPPRYVPCHKSVKKMVKLNELNFELLPTQPHSPDLAPSNYWLFAQREISRGYINQKNLIELNMVSSTTKHSLGDKRSRNNNLKTGCNN